MASISSPGIGSGMDISGIVTKLVAVERQPLVQLQKAASSMQSRLSLFGQVKSQLAAVEDAARKLGSPAGWGSMAVSSSNPAAISANSVPGSSPASFSVEVTRLAKQQVSVVAPTTSGAPLGNGLLTLQQGSWSAAGVFVAGGGVPVTITIDSSANTLAAIAGKINSSGGGVQAMVVQAAEGERLVLRSTETGAASGFNVSLSSTSGGQEQGGGANAPYGDLSFTAPPPAQQAQDARFLVDGLEFTSPSNTVTEALPGVSLQLTQVTTTPVDIKLTQDKEAVKKSIQALVDAYNTVNSTLANNLKYNPDTKVAAPLQGDSAALGLQNAMRNLMRSEMAGQPFERLQDVGISLQLSGSLAVNSTKLDAALNKPAELKQFFTSTTTGQTRGFGLQVADFISGALSSEGRVTVRTDALQAAIKRNSTDQDRVNARAERAQARLYEVYNAMDGKVGKLNAISSYVSQQLSSPK
ncbi:MAG: flagellar filament capping protein FliD [Polaromonas sp.]|jgi:flagellar hook-associated protein 2